MVRLFTWNPRYVSSRLGRHEDLAGFIGICKVESMSRILSEVCRATLARERGKMNSKSSTHAYVVTCGSKVRIVLRTGRT